MQVVDEEIFILNVLQWPIAPRRDIELAFGLAAIERFLRPGEILDKAVYIVLI